MSPDFIERHTMSATELSKVFLAPRYVIDSRAGIAGNAHDRRKLMRMVTRCMQKAVVGEIRKMMIEAATRGRI